MITPEKAWETFLRAHDLWETLPCEFTEKALAQAGNLLVSALFVRQHVENPDCEATLQ